MLRHRGWSTTTTAECHEDPVTWFTMSDGHQVAVVDGTLKKAHVTAISARPGLDARQLLLTGPAITTPAHQLARTLDLEFVPSSLYQFDLLSFHMLPTYTVMTEASIAHFETRHKCPRDKWPAMSHLDPIAVYLGLRPGQCLHLCDAMYRTGVRHVRSV